MFRAKMLGAVVCGLLVTGCGSDTAITDPSQATFAPSLGIDLSKMTKSASGLYTRDLTVGTGTVATNGKRVSIYYTGWLIDGTEFDSRQPPAATFTFPLGVGQVVQGFDEGVLGMKIGGRRQLVIPPALGYGAQRQDPIPPNSILVFQIDLIAVQ